MERQTSDLPQVRLYIVYVNGMTGQVNLVFITACVMLVVHVLQVWKSKGNVDH